MATKARVLAYFEECEVAQSFAAMTQGMSNQLAQQFVQDGDPLAAEYAIDQGALMVHLQNKVLERLVDIYCDLYTDEEIDQLSALYHLPISQRNRELLPETQRRVASVFTNLQTDMIAFLLKRDFSKFVDKAIAATY